MNISKLSLVILSALCTTTVLNAQLLDLTNSEVTDFKEEIWSHFENENSKQAWEVDLGNEYFLFGISKDELFLPLPIGREHSSLRLSVYDANSFPVYDESIAPESSGLTILFPEGTFGRWIRFSFIGNEDIGTQINELKVFGYVKENETFLPQDGVGINTESDSSAVALDNRGLMKASLVADSNDLKTLQQPPEATASAVPMLLQATADESMTIEYQYNARGELIRVSNGTQSRTIEYDQRGNMTKM